VLDDYKKKKNRVMGGDSTPKSPPVITPL